MHVEVGQVLLRKYLVDRLVGQGAMGSVYEARDYAQDRRVAVRLIEIESDHARALAFSESDARLAGELGGNHIAELVDVDTLPSGEPCLVHEFIDGETLRARIDRLGATSELGAIQLLDQLIRGLVRAHAAGVVHRDFTPRSIFITPRAAGDGDCVKMIDFGLSRIDLVQSVAPQSVVKPESATPSDIDSFQYLSPEQLSGLRELDPRSNVYSLGVIAYEALTGKLPFEGNSISALALNILQLDPTPVEVLAPRTSPGLARLVRKAMARTPNARFRTAEDLFTAIAEIASGAGLTVAPLEVTVPRAPSGDTDDGHSNERASAAPQPDVARESQAEHPLASSIDVNVEMSPVVPAAQPASDVEHDEQTPPIGVPSTVSALPSRQTQPSSTDDPVRAPSAAEGVASQTAESEAEAPTNQPTVDLPEPSARSVASGAAADASASQQGRLMRRIPSVRPGGVSQAAVSRPAASVRPTASVRPAPLASKSASRADVPASERVDATDNAVSASPHSRKLLYSVIGLMSLVIVGLAVALLSGKGDPKSDLPSDATGIAKPDIASSAAVALPPPAAGSVVAPAAVAAANSAMAPAASAAAAKPSHVAAPAAAAPAVRAKATQTARQPTTAPKSNSTAGTKKTGTQKRDANKDPYNYR